MSHATTTGQACTGAPVLAAVAVADDADRKTLATLQARAALAGWVLGGFTDDDGCTTYCLSKWGRPLTLPDLAAVALHLRRVGVPE